MHKWYKKENKSVATKPDYHWLRQTWYMYIKGISLYFKVQSSVLSRGRAVALQLMYTNI